jgi:TolB-like protein/DNA-binding winged helix-turn-helix (wHTH) protein/tetratricopeptide (TPR) repeat protein
MQVPATHKSIHFGSFAVDLTSHELIRDGRRISLQEKPFQILAILLERPGDLVSREELRAKLWPADTFVDFEHSINTAVKKLRHALGDEAETPHYIETLPRRGYRFIVSVKLLSGNGAQISADSPSQRLLATPVLIHKPTQEHENAIQPATVPERSGRTLSTWIRRRKYIFVGVTIGLVSLLLAEVALWYWRSQAITPSSSSVAVLPFADLSLGHEYQYFSEGLAEEILSKLTKIPNLRVTGRGSAFQFKSNGDLRQIARKLHVANVLEGSVQRESNRIRVTARLTKAEDGFHIWSDSFDREVKDIFDVEDDIAKAVTSALQVKLLTAGSLGATVSSSTTKPEAYEAFLQARYFSHMQDEASEKKALQYANTAINADPEFAPAYALRASIEIEAGGMTWMDLSDAASMARQDIQKTIALDPNLPDGYRVLSMMQAHIDSNCRASQASLKRAMDLAPGDPESIDLSAWIAMCLGKPEEAVDLWQQELVLDPLKPEDYLWLAQSLRDIGRYQEAHAAVSKALDLNPNQISMIHEVAGEIYLAEGRPQEAIKEMQQEHQDLFRDLGEALAYFALGEKQESDAALARMIAHNSSDGAYQIAQVYGYRGEGGAAFQWLDRAYAQHDPGLMWFKTDLKFKKLRGDSRYFVLLKKLNLSA